MLRYRLRDWSTAVVKLRAVEPILAVELSSDSKWLAFRDQEGVKLSERPFGSTRTVSDTNPIWGYGLSFSHDNRFLAYSDGYGLKVYDLLSNESRVLKLSQKNSEIEGFCENVAYFPYRWSTDDRWLVVEKQYCEGFGLVLAHVPTGRFHDFTNCGGDLEWSNSSDLVIAVSYHGREGCGENDGVFILSAGSNHFTEKRIYTDPIPVKPWDRETSYANWSSKGSWISFVQRVYTGVGDAGYDRLMVIRPDGSDVRTLVVGQGNIETPFWLPNEDRILFVLQDRQVGESSIFSVDVNTLEKQDYGRLDDRASIAAVSPVGEWLILSLSNSSYPPSSRWQPGPFVLMNIVDQMTIKIPETVYINKGTPEVMFLAWE